MTRPQLENSSRSRLRAHARDWAVNTLVLAMFFLLGTVVYLSTIVGRLDARITELSRIETEVRDNLREHLTDADIAHCTLFKRHDVLDASCPPG